MYEAIGENSKKKYVAADNPELIHQWLLVNYPSELPSKIATTHKTRVPAKVLPEPMRIN